MVSPTLQRLLREQSQSASKIVSHFCKRHSPLPPFIRTQILPQTTMLVDELSLYNNPKRDCLSPDRSLPAHVYPTFSFGLFLNPISRISIVGSEADEETTQDESRIIRADSVKKKRKRKMNKHKLRKLRKRLRRKT